MSDGLSRVIQQISAVATIFVAASYSFTLGYIAHLKIPETPEYLEATNAFIRAVFHAKIDFAFLHVILPIACFLGLLFLLEWLNKKLISKFKCLECCESLLRYLIYIILTVIFAFCMYCSGKNYFNDKGSFFPMGHLFDQRQKERPIFWPGKKAIYYLDCDNPWQYVLKGANDEKEDIFTNPIRGNSSLFALCE